MPRYLVPSKLGSLNQNKVVVMLFKNTVVRISIVAASIFSFSSLSFASNLEAKKDGVKIYSEAKKTSEVIKVLKKGETVKELNRKGMYWSVELEDGKSGFVSVIKVKRKKIENSKNFSVALKRAVQQGRNNDDSSNVRSRSAVMGVRGLDESSDVEFAGNVKPNKRMVVSMENIVVDPKDIDQLADLVSQEIEFKIKNKKNK